MKYHQRTPTYTSTDTDTLLTYWASDGTKNIILLFSELGQGMNILQDDDKNGKTKKRKRGKCIDTIIDGR